MHEGGRHERPGSFSAPAGRAEGPARMTGPERPSGTTGDRPAFGALVTSRLALTFRVAVAILGSEADARSAVEATWRSVRTLLAAAPSGSRMDAWLVRLLVDACRTAGQGPRQAVPVVEELDTRTPIASVDAMRDAGGLGGAFERLDIDQRALITLQHLEQWPVAAIADLLGVAADVATRQLHTARIELDRLARGERSAGR